jgi:hypothetical protein
VKRLLILFFCLSAPTIRADQISPGTPQGVIRSDDLDEVEDVAGDRDFLPSDHSAAPIDPKRIKSVEAAVGEILVRSDADIRNDHSLAVAMVRGTASPWQGVSLDVQAILTPTSTLGLMIGTGVFEEEGEVDERSFDLSYKSRAVGFGWKNYWSNYEPFGWQLFFGLCLLGRQGDSKRFR